MPSARRARRSRRPSGASRSVCTCARRCAPTPSASERCTQLTHASECRVLCVCARAFTTLAARKQSGAPRARRRASSPAGIAAAPAPRHVGRRRRRRRRRAHHARRAIERRREKRKAWRRARVAQRPVASLSATPRTADRRPKQPRLEEDLPPLRPHAHAFAGRRRRRAAPRTHLLAILVEKRAAPKVRHVVVPRELPERRASVATCVARARARARAASSPRIATRRTVLRPAACVRACARASNCRRS